MLLVEKVEGGFQCFVGGAPGSPVCGRGMTVAEAVGDWTIQSGRERVICEEPHYWDFYKAEDILAFKPIDRRD
jgi:hypothetical protein